MKNKRLKHHAFIFCHMFCGWQLLHDYKAISELKEGEILIDILTQTCFHNGKPMQPLVMASILNSWMNEDLESNNIPLSAIEKAQLKVKFHTEKHKGQRNQAVRWTRPTSHFISCRLDCVGVIATDEKEYFGHYSEIEEWPTNYGG